MTRFGESMSLIVDWSAQNCGYSYARTPPRPAYLVHPRHHDYGDFELRSGHDEVESAGGNQDSAVGQHGVAADHHFVAARHHREGRSVVDERRLDVAVGQIEGELLSQQRGKRLANHHVDVPTRSIRRVRLAKERADGVGLRVGENDLATIDPIHDSDP